MIDRYRWPRKERWRWRTKGANGSGQIQSVSSLDIKEDVAGFARTHKYDTFLHSEKKKSDMSFQFPRHRVRDLNLDGSKKENDLYNFVWYMPACISSYNLQDGLQRHRKQYGFLCFRLPRNRLETFQHDTTTNNLLLYTTIHPETI